MQTFHFDLSTKSVAPVLNVKQGDVGRKFKAVITDGGVPYNIPAGAHFSVWYSGPSGEGNYSAIGERSAFTVDGNTVTVELIAQMLQNPGTGAMCLVLNAVDGSQIGLWNVIYSVEAVPGMGSKTAQEYYTALAELARQAIEAAATFETDTTLFVSGKAADAAATGAALAGKAPAGYGLGERTPRHISSVEELDLFTDSGWYSLLCNSGLYITPEYFFAYGWMRVDSYGEGLCTQTLRRIQSEDTIMRHRTSTGGWGAWVRCDPSAFAPSGYGLGEAVSRAWSEVDSIISPGWYRFSGLPFDAFQYANMRVDAWDVNNLRQTMYPLMGTNSEMRREKINGVWQEWEWVNPHMALGVEYRTTERWNGKAVWTVWVSLGAIAAGQTTISTDYSASYVIRRAATKGTNAAPQHYQGDNEAKYCYWVNGNVVSGKISFDVFMGSMNSGNMYCQVWYTKD